MYSKFRKILCAMMLLALVVTLFEGSQHAYAADLADGTYTIDYVIKKPEDESVSMANDYWEKPATVIVSGGAIKMRMTINHSVWVTKFKVPSGGNFADAKFISENSGEDTRVVEFSLGSLDKSMLSQIHVTVPEIDYDHDYTIRFVYNTDTLTLISKPESTTTAKPTTTPKPAPSANSGSKETDTSTVKQAEGTKESPQPEKSTAIPTKEPSETSTTKPEPTNTAIVEPTTEPANVASNSSEQETEDNTSSLPQTEESGEQVDQQQDNKSNEENSDKVELENTEDQTTVELSTALDGAIAGDSTEVVASVADDSSKNKGIIIITVASILLVACAVLFVIYRKRKPQNS